MTEEFDAKEETRVAVVQEFIQHMVAILSDLEFRDIPLALLTERLATDKWSPIEVKRMVFHLQKLGLIDGAAKAKKQSITLLGREVLQYLRQPYAVEERTFGLTTDFLVCIVERISCAEEAVDLKDIIPEPRLAVEVLGCLVWLELVNVVLMTKVVVTQRAINWLNSRRNYIRKHSKP